MHDDGLMRARQLLADATSVTVLTGAGVSAESGVPTFRGADGLWKGASPIELASPEGFARDPHRVWEWYNLRRRGLMSVQPNPGHWALARFERRVPQFGLITQNVDRLHHLAGSKALVELHGNIWEVRCTACQVVFDRTGVELPSEPRCERCHAWLRPGVVWFGEILPPAALRTAESWSERCGVFLIVGTSAVVWPAAGLVSVAKDAGATVIEINLEETPATDLADIALRGKAGEILPGIVGGE
jgi:NAD-dependent protein deacetylase/lipoamidase